MNSRKLPPFSPERERGEETAAKNCCSAANTAATQNLGVMNVQQEGTRTQNCSLTNLTTEQKKKPQNTLTTRSLLRIFSLYCDNNYCESGILNIINIYIYTMCVQVLTHSEWNRSPVSSSCTFTLTTCWRQTIDQLWPVSIFILILLNNVYIFVFWFKCM